MVKIKKGDKFLCTKDFIMDDGSIAYSEGKTYTSDEDDNLPSNYLDAHTMSKVKEFWEHFKLEGDLNEEKNKALRYNTGKPQYSLLDLKSMEPGVRVLEFGAKKYERDNWKKGLPLSEILDSMLRHIAALQDGQWIDPESNLPHIGHIQCNALFLGGKNLGHNLNFNDFDFDIKTKEECCGNWNSDGECKCKE